MICKSPIIASISGNRDRSDVKSVLNSFNHLLLDLYGCMEYGWLSQKYYYKTNALFCLSVSVVIDLRAIDLESLQNTSSTFKTYSFPIEVDRKPL